MRVSVLATLALLSAQSVLAEEALLSWSRNSGGNPMKRRTWTCEIFEKTVSKASYRRGETANPTETKIAFSDSVRSAAQIKSLLRQAKKGKLVERNAPIGGGSSKMEGKGGVVLMKRLGMLTENRSEAARTLVEFVHFNCSEQ